MSWLKGNCVMQYIGMIVLGLLGGIFGALLAGHWIVFLSGSTASAMFGAVILWLVDHGYLKD
jgi:hypothetical protein